MAIMEYHFSDSEYVGTASNGTVVHVDESEFAEAVHDALRLGYDITAENTPDAEYQAAYERERDRLLEADEWVGLIGDNPNVTAD